jgi:flagellar biosynthetic protein FliP
MTRNWLRLLPVIGTVILFSGLATSLHAQNLSLSFDEGGSLSGRTVQLLLLLTVLSLAPGIAITITCFPFLITVFSILRQALGLQQSPPNMLMVSLALFLTYFVMEPVFSEAWEAGIEPMLQEEIDTQDALQRSLVPFRSFMAAQVDPDTVLAMAALRPEPVADLAPESLPLSILMPSFLLSEISRAFQIGFLVFLPFLVIDLVVAAILMSMGMMMVPPAMVALPFKLSFFVVSDGWTLLSTALVRGYGT